MQKEKAMQKHRKKAAICNPRREPSIDTSPVDLLILDF
jgi:hypothetical protein